MTLLSVARGHDQRRGSPIGARMGLESSRYLLRSIDPHVPGFPGLSTLPREPAAINDVLMGKTASISARSAADRVDVTQPAVFRRIVACIDSASEQHALEGAARVLARRTRSQVLVIHVRF